MTRSLPLAAALALGLTACFPIPPARDGGVDGGTGGGNVGGGAGGGSGGGGGGGGAGGGSTVNLPPHFTSLADVTVDEDSPELGLLIQGITAGSTFEDVTQQVFLDAGTDAPALLGTRLFPGDGGPTLGLTPRLNANGAGHVTLTAVDNGFPSGSYAQTINVTVRPVNDPPTIAPLGLQVVVPPGPSKIALTGITPGGGPDEAAQPLSITAVSSSPGLLTGLTASLDGGTGGLLTISTAPNANGPTNITVTINDGQPLKNLTQMTFPVVVAASTPTVTDATIAAGTQSGCVTVGYVVTDSHSYGADVRLEVDRGGGTWGPGSISGGPLTNVTSSPAGTSHSLVWRSDSDFPDGVFTGAKIRLIASRFGVDTAPREATVNVSNAIAFVRTNFQAGPGAFAATAVDVDNDGLLDVITPDSFADTISILKGNGDAGFAAPKAFTASPAMCGGQPSKPFSVSTGDFNLDGRLDVLVANENCMNVSVVLGASDGGFGPYATYAAGGNPLFSRSADFNHDGKLDVAVVNYASSDVSILIGAGDGGFLPAATYPVGTNANKIDLGDFDKDGELDLVTANATANSISLLLGIADGGFKPRRDFPAGTGPRNMSVGDFNGDGLLDVATANPGPNNDATEVAVLLQTDAGFFGPPTLYTAQIHPRSVATGDLNGDGRLDFVVGNVDSSSVSVFLGRGDGTFWPAHNLTVGAGTHSVQLVDLNGDGRPEILTGNANDSTITVLVNQTNHCQ